MHETALCLNDNATAWFSLCWWCFDKLSNR